MPAKNMISTLDTLVSALCLDYERREEAILTKSVSRRTETEFKYYNFKIFDAAAEIVGDRFAVTYIKEIGNHVGYAKTEIDCVSEITYKTHKSLVKQNIARKLHLCD